MSGVNYRGLEAHEELSSKKLMRDTRPLWQVIAQSFIDRTTAAGTIAMLAVPPLIFPLAMYPCLGLGALVLLIRSSMVKQERLPFRLPTTAGGLDYSDPIPGRKSFFKAGGIFFFGNEARTGRELWIKAKDLLTHLLVFATTGGGKTEFLLSLAYNVLAMGSGYFYIDPKGTTKLPFQNYVMCRMLGRDDDFRVLNYSTAGKVRGHHPVRLTNTNNPFAFGSAEALTQLLVALIPSADGDNAIFGQNAQTLITALMFGLVELRDRGEVDLSIATIRDHLNLQKYAELAERPDLTPATSNALKAFLRGCGGWKEGTPLDKQPRSLPEQFSYAVGYFNLAVASFTDTFGHIYLPALGEVNMDDVILKRRILITVLPALEMAPAQLKNTGQIALSAVRNACAVGLGKKLEGTAEDVVFSLPTDSPTPFLSITDEYAAIPTPGYAEVLTQGRGLGIAAVVASQDYGGIKRADEGAAKQIIANTKIKLCGVLEDPEDTWDLFQKLASEASIMQTSGFHIDKNGSDMALSYRDQLSTSVSKVCRVNFLDLMEQIEGEYHGFFKGKIVRMQSFYADPPILPHSQLRVAQHLKVRTPDVRHLKMRLGEIRELTDKLVEKAKKTEPAEIPAMPDTIAKLQMVFDNPRGLEGRMEQAIAAFLNWRSGNDEQLAAFLQEREKQKALAAQQVVEHPADLEETEDFSPGEDDFAPDGFDLPEEETGDEVYSEAERAAIEQALPPGLSILPETEDNSWVEKFQTDTGWIANEALDKDLTKMETLLGASEEQASQVAVTVRQKVVQGLRYPEPPTPDEDQGEEELTGLIQNLIAKGKAKQ